jgi:enoyl-CoA hydratase/isomerase-like protein
MLYTGNRIGADEALRLGLVDHVVPIEQLMSKCEEIATEICESAPLAAHRIKQAKRGTACPAEKENAICSPLVRIRLAENDVLPLTFDVTFEKKVPPYFEDRHASVNDVGGRPGQPPRLAREDIPAARAAYRQPPRSSRRTASFTPSTVANLCAFNSACGSLSSLSVSAPASF